MLGCLLLGVLLILSVLAPPIGIPLLLITLVVMVVTGTLRVVIGALGGIGHAAIALVTASRGAPPGSYRCARCGTVFPSRHEMVAHQQRDHAEGAAPAAPSPVPIPSIPPPVDGNVGARFCPKCGVERQSGMRFCGGCGFDLESLPARGAE